MWDQSHKSLSDMLQVDQAVNQFGRPNLMADFIPKTELDPDPPMGMYGGPMSGPVPGSGPGPGPGPNLAPNMGPNVGPNVPGPTTVNMGPQLSQHSKFRDTWCISLISHKELKKLRDKQPLGQETLVQFLF